MSTLADTGKGNYLLIDCGNTRIKWAYITDITLHPASNLQLSAHYGWAAYGAHLHAEIQELAAAWANLDDVEAILIANVAGSRIRENILQALRASDKQHVPIEWFASSATRAGIHNAYKQPSQLGCDRFAAVIGAHAMLPGKNILLANCGTATTIDAVTAKGEFLGGMILPGLGLMAKALARDTAQLPYLQELSADPGQLAILPQFAHSFADNTEQAILSGCINAQAGAIEKAVRELEHRLAQPVHCLISGGAAFVIAPGLTILHQMLDNLVLLGLHTALREDIHAH